MFVRRLWVSVVDFFKKHFSKPDVKQKYAYADAGGGKSKSPEDTGSFSPRTEEGQERLRRFKEMSETVMYEEIYKR